MQSIAYKVFFTEKGKSTYDSCLNYILYKFKNPFATQSLYDDVQEILDLLGSIPESFPICENTNLAKRQVRKIHLKRHKYKLFYRVVQKNVFIDAILHDSQDYENILQ